MATPPTRSTTGRSGAQVTKREFDQLRTDIMAQFAATRQEMQAGLQAMLPRELYNANHSQLIEDIGDLRARLQKTEQTVIDLNAQLLSVKQATAQTPAQISAGNNQVRLETVSRALEMLSRVALMVGGGLVTLAAYYLGTHH